VKRTVSQQRFHEAKPHTPAWFDEPITVNVADFQAPA
jgi:hypothetical protein